MACAALKRPHNFDLLKSSSSPEQLAANKRRRCGAMAAAVSPSATKSPFLEATPKVCRDELTKCVHDEWKRLHRRRKLLSPPSSPSNQQQVQQTMSTCMASSSSSQGPSSFWNSPLSSQSLSMSPPRGSQSPPQGSMSPSGGMSPPRGKEPALSIKQAVQVCERLWKEREEKIREEYDQVLHEKLGEQYDSFLKFTQDQIIRKYQQSSCSYVS